MPATAAELLEKTAAIVESLPETRMTSSGQHAAFRVGKKKFAWFLNDHHGDGMICICMKVDPEEKENLIDVDPGKYLRPAYISRFGWMSIRVDDRAVDWAEVRARLVDSFRSVAPKRVSKLLAAS